MKGDYRIVILARSGELTIPDPQIIGQNVTFARTEGGYQAAAELLAAPAVAILIDLPCLTPPHRKLLQVARELGVEILGVGAFPVGFSADDLSGMRLISMDDLPSVLRAILPKEAPPAPAAPVAAPAPKKKPESMNHKSVDDIQYRSEMEPPRHSRIISPAPGYNAAPSSGRDDS
ncbi:MAG: hypothetical protein JXA11_00165 [Phycisphaerae bacterium]|nr:hypothetical protein [Phycisphaerae bacterium]